jgi:hypothetical protein
LIDNVEAVLELAKNAKANKKRGGRNESNYALHVHRRDLFGGLIKGVTALYSASLRAGP